MATPTISTQRLTLLPTPFDAKRCNYYVDGSNIIIETIPQYLTRVFSGIRDTDLSSILIPKAGYVSLGTYPLASFSSVLANFDNIFYGFVDGFADVNFVQIVYSQDYIDSGDRRLSTGAIIPPTIVDNGDGTATFSEIDVNIYPLPDYGGDMKTYTVAEETFTFTNGAEEYVSVRYNAGSPVFYKETVGTAMNHSNILPIFVIWRLGSVIHSLNFDSLGLGLANKAQSAMYHTSLYKLSTDGGLVISETTSPSPRTIVTTAGMIYTGAVHQDVSSFNSFTDQMTFAYHVGGTWTYIDNLVYNNLKYDDGINLLDISNNKYAVRWFYRSVGDNKQLFYVCGSVGTYSSPTDAALEQPRTDLPLILQHHCILIGRAIIQYNIASGVTQSLTQSTYNFSSVINHDDTGNKSLAASGVTWGHIDNQAQTIVGTKTFNNLRAGGIANYTEFETDGSMRMVGDATVFDDMLGDITQVFTIGPGVSLDVTESTIDFTTAANLSDYILVNYQMKHGWKAGSSIFPHIHWFQNSNATPNFLIQYRWQRNGQAKATAWTNYKCSTSNAFTYVSGTLDQISYGAALPAPVNYSLSDILQFRVLRDVANTSGVFTGADTYAGDAELTGVDCHYEISQIGSRTEYAV